MCTAVSLKTESHYFGRNLDMDFSYGEKVVITPRKYPFSFRCEATIESHYAIIGTAITVKDYPLYFDAANEKGLSIAGLRFPEAVYPKKGDNNKSRISPFELIPWILSRCEDIKQVKTLMENTALVSINFSEDMPLSPLHWIVCDKNNSIVIESTADGMAVYDNEVGVLTNSPAFPFQMINLTQHMNLTADNLYKGKVGEVNLKSYCLGLGSVGLPGDYSSLSRFVRAAFVRQNSLCDGDEEASVAQFFHILDSVYQPRGCVRLEGNKQEHTVYSSCCNTDTGVYYCKTYSSLGVCAVDMRKENLEGKRLIIHSMKAVGPTICN